MGYAATGSTALFHPLNVLLHPVRAVSLHLVGDMTVHIQGKRRRIPNLIVGDFDSHKNPQLNIETIVLPCEKDDTDTVFAVKVALKRGFQDFLMVGVIGGRLDHSLGNVSLLLMLDAHGKRAVILDDYSEMEIVSRKPMFIQDQYAYFSLLNISGIAQGITIKNAKFPLIDAEISCEYQYGISNEVLPGMTAEVTIENGRLLLIKVLPATSLV